MAVGFLTRLPVPVGGDLDDDRLARATTFFPVVGAVVGSAVGVSRWSLEAALGGLGASVVAVAVGIAMTGAFHEDGWADTFDGLWGGWTPERRIEIMRDSRLGTYGAAALLLALLLQVSLAASLPPWRAAAALGAGHVLGRLMILVQIRLTPPVSDQGTGARVARPVPVGAFVAVSLFAVVGAAAVLGWALLAAVPAALATTVLFGAIARRKVGGLTGDVLGATAMAGLLATLVAVTAVTRLGS